MPPNEGRKHKFKLIFLLIIALLGGFLPFSSVLAATGINKQINFQGKVVNTDGTNVSNASYNFLFCIYNTASPTTPCTSGADNDAIWRESKSLTTADGIFQTNLGDTTSLPGSVDFNTDNIYLGINFNSNGQMTPLVRFTAAPYAMNSDKVGGLGTADLIVKSATANQTVTSTQTSGAVVGVTDTTGISAAIKGLSITLSGTGAFDQTGLEFNLSGASGTNLNDIVGTGSAWKVSKAGAATVTSLVSSGVIAANGGITFDQASDTIGSFTSNGTILMNSNILQDIGNTGTDFIASTGALTLAGVLTANGGISLAGSQSLSAAALSFVDLGSITHSTTANQGLKLPNAASATPSNPTSGEGYLAWDTAGDQLITYNGTAWTTVGGSSGYNLVKDETTSLTARTTLAFLGAGVSCQDLGGQTECTISGGSGSDLQGTYGADADGGNATISLTAADDGLVFTNPTSGGTDGSAFLLSLTQQHTTAAVVALDITQSSNAANGMNLAANSIDGETGLAITTNGLTSGKGISITSSVAASFTGNLADISLTGSAASNTGNVLAVSNTGTANANTTLFVDHRATGTDNLALRVNDEASDTTPFIIDGSGRVGIGTATISDNASTERLLQVGSETNRGNNVTYGEVITKGQRDITALTNIKDIYVYDTTADSDGGRWIDWATTDKLSWFTETLDDGPSDPCVIASDDRCYKSSFPRKAILAVTSDALYIFDAQDNTLWMKFSQNASGYALGVDTNNDPSSVTAQNGVIYVGTNGSAAGGLYAFDFTSDRMWNYDGTDRSGADVGIGSRNSVVTYNSDNNTNFDLATVGTLADWGKINDVSVAVMQFSTTAITINAATNIAPNNGTTLVALATDSGITVINLSRQRIVQYSDATDNDYNAVAITRTGKLYGLNEALGQAEKWINIDQDQVSEVNGAPDKVWDEASTPALAKTTPTVIAAAPDALEVVERGSLADGGLLSTATVPGSSDLIYVGTSLGLTEIHDHSTATMGWSKFFDTNRQTALMPGTIKRAHMMNDASGDLTDDSFRVNTMAPIGGVTYGINGVRGKAVTLDGTSGFFCSDNGGAACAADADDNMSTTGWNLSMWFKHSAAIAGTDVLYSRCYNTTPAAAAACVTIYMPSAGTMVAAYDDDATWTAYSSYDVTATSTRTYNDNQWHQAILSRNNAGIINFYIDGTPINLSTATASTLTLDASQIVAIGADCSVGAACATGANFWDGSIDDFTFSQGTTTVDALLPSQARRLYNDARPLVNKKVISVTDATTATSTTIGDSGEAWIPNEFAGQVMEITGGTGAGQTRRVTGNTATILTVSPAFTSTPDTTSDFEINPEQIYGASNSVTSIGITGESAMGEARQMCVGTNSGTDTGGVTCFNHQAGPNLVADVYHADAKQLDDSSTEWTGTDYDDIQSIDISGRAMVIGSMAHMWTETQDVRLGQGMDYLSNKIFDLNNAIKNLGMQTLAGSGSVEVGLTGGADLAEHYYSNEKLDAGNVVSIDTSLEAGVKKTSGAYQRDTLGVVATTPGIILGTQAENSYPIALVGRVPVKVTNENGQIYAGDRLTSASRSGYAMRTTQAGRVIGEALADASDWAVCEGEDQNDINAKLCTTVSVFVNLTDYYGQSVELAMAKSAGVPEATGLANAEVTNSTEQGFSSDTNVHLVSSAPTKQEQILSFLKDLRERQETSHQNISEVFTGRVSASQEVITPKIFADEIFAKHIKADSIEGLEIFTDSVKSLQEKYAGLESAATAGVRPVATDETAPTTVKQLAIAMKNLSADTLTVQLDGNILGKLSVAGALRIGGEAQFAGDTVFEKLVSFFSDVLFKGRVAFEKTPTFGADTAGFAVIEKGAKKVHIEFDEPYEHQPIVAITLTNDQSPLLNDKADTALVADVAAVEKDYINQVFDADMKYIVTEKSATGFTIVLSKKAPQDLQFSWVAVAVKKSKTFTSDKNDVGTDTSGLDTPAIETPTDILPAVSTPVPTESVSLPAVETTLLDQIETIPPTDTSAQTTQLETTAIESGG